MTCKRCGSEHLVRWQGGTDEYRTRGWQCAECDEIQDVVRPDAELVSREWGFRSWAAMAMALDMEERLQREGGR